MFKIWLSLASLLLLADVSFAQVQASAETRYRVAGIEGWQSVEDVVFAPEGSEPVLKPVGWVTVASDAAIIRIKAETEDRRRLEVKQFTSTEFGILGTGTIWVDVTIVDFEKQIFDQDSFVIEVGPDDPPPPDPDEPDEPDEPDNPDPDEPDDGEVPEDPFDNLGRRIDSQADEDNLQMDKRFAVAAMFADVADKMESREIKRASDAREYLNQQLRTLQTGPEWQATLKVADTDGRNRPPLDYPQTIAWYRAVAAGFKGGAL